MLTFKTRVVVRFSDVDYAGNVYYPRLIHYFHLAFEDFLASYLGLPLSKVMEKDRLGFPAVHVESDFSRPLRFGDTAEIEVTIERVGEGSATFCYLVRAEGQPETCATGRVTVAAVDLETFTPIRLPDKYRALFVEYRARAMQSSDQNVTLDGDEA